MGDEEQETVGDTGLTPEEIDAKLEEARQAHDDSLSFPVEDPTNVSGEETPTPEDLTTGATAAIPEEPITEDGEAPAPLPPIITESAFLVYLDPGGHWVADSDHLGAPVMYQRQANRNDFFHAAATIQKDITTNEAAAGAVGMMQQTMAQAAAQMRDAQMHAQVAAEMAGRGGIDLSKLKRG